MAKNTNNDNGTIGAFYGKERFVKIKECWNIGKIRLDFVRTDANNKAVSSGEFFLDIESAGCLAREICEGSLQKRAMAAVEESVRNGEKNPSKVLFIRQGGTPEGKAKRPDGKATARVFSIIPSKSPGCPVCFRLEIGPGHSTAQGLIVPDWWKSGGSKELDLVVPVNNDGGTKDYLRNGPLDKFGIALNGAINGYYVKGMLDGTLFTNNYSGGGEGGDSYDPGEYGGETGAESESVNNTVRFDSALTVSGNNPDMYYADVTGKGLEHERVWFDRKKLGSRMDEFIAASASGKPVTLDFEKKTDGRGGTYIIAV